MPTSSYQPEHRGRTHSVITRGDFPGDKTGVLQLRRGTFDLNIHYNYMHIIIPIGKKSPVYGKWKEFYFHLKYKDQKLLYYDSEKVHLYIMFIILNFYHRVIALEVFLI